MPFDSITHSDVLEKSVQPSDDCSSKPSSCRRRSRAIYTSDQLKAMEYMFSTDRYPDFNARLQLADAIGLTESRIQVI